jgi:YceI-like domain
MFRKLMGRTLLILGLVPFCLPVYAESGSYNLSINSGSHLWLDGNSTLHKFESVTSTFTLKTSTFTADSPTIPDINTLIDLISGNFIFDVPVQSLKNPAEGSSFDNNLWTDLKYKQNPDIIFSLASATATPDPSVAGRYNISAQGSLTVAGKENPASISAIFDINDNTLRITGTQDLLMTDFGIKPRTIFFVIKTDDKVTVRWDLSLSAKPSTTTSGGGEQSQTSTTTSGGGEQSQPSTSTSGGGEQ